MAITIDELIYSVGLDDSDMREGTTRIEKTIRGLSQFSAGLVGSLGMPLQMLGSWEAAGEMIQQAGHAIYEFSREAAGMEIVSSRFENLARSADMSASDILASMEDATDGLLTEYDRIRFANKLLLADIQLTPDQFEEVMLIARGAAQATGESFDYMASSIIEALSKQEREILDNLGIIVDADATYEKYAQQIGVDTVSALTDQQKIQGWVNEALEKGTANLERMGGVQETSIDSYQRMNVAMRETQLALGQLFVPTVTSALEVFSTGIFSLADGLEQLPPLFESAQEKAERLTQTFQDMKLETESQIQSIDELQAEYSHLNNRLDDENLSADESRRLHSELDKIIKQISDTVPGAAAVFRKYGNDVNQVNQYLERTKEVHSDLLRFEQRETAQAIRDAYLEANKELHRAEEDIVAMQERINRRMRTTEEEWLRASMQMASSTGVSMTIPFETFQEQTIQLGKQLDTMENDFEDLGASAEKEAARISQFIEQVQLGDAVEGIRELNAITESGVKLTEEQTSQLRSYQAEIRDAFGLGVEEGNKWIETLLQIYQEVEYITQQQRQTLGPPAPPIVDVEQLTKDVKSAVEEFERAQRVAAKSAGEAYKPNLEAIHNIAQETLRAKLAEKEITDETIIYQQEKYAELADYMLSLFEKVAEERTKIEEDAKEDRVKAAEEAAEREAELVELEIEAIQSAREMRAKERLERKKGLEEIAKLETDITAEIEEQVDHTLDARIQETARKNDEKERERSLEYQNELFEKQLELAHKGYTWVLKLQEDLDIPETWDTILDNKEDLEEIAWIPQKAGEEWGITIDDFRAGLDAMGVQLDDLTISAFNFAQAFVAGDTIGAVISGISFISTWLEGPGANLMKYRAQEEFRSRLEYIQNEQARLEELLEFRYKRLKEIEKGASLFPKREAAITRELIEEIKRKLEELAAEVEHIIAGERMFEGVASEAQNAWATIFDPDNVKDPLEIFTDSLNQILLNEIVQMFSQSSDIAKAARELGEHLSIALEDGMLSQAEIIEFEKFKASLLEEFDYATNEFKLAATLLGIEFADETEEIGEKTAEAFSSGFLSAISGALTRAFQEEFDIIAFGEDLAEQFNRSFLNIIVDQMLEVSTMKPMLEKFEKSLFEAMKDGVLDPLEVEMLRTQRSQIMALSHELANNVDDALTRLDIEFEQKEAEAAAKRETDDIEAFQTISNITRYQANQIIAQLSLHSSYLQTIADTNTQIVELNQAIAHSTRALRTQALISGNGNGIDEKALANKNINNNQAQGIQLQGRR